MIKKVLTGGAAALFLTGTTALAAPITVDLGFILDESGSVGETNYESTVSALATALQAVPYDDPDIIYRVGVVSFGGGADTVVAPTAITSAAIRSGVIADLVTEATSGYGNPSGITNATQWSVGMDRLVADFVNAGGVGDVSIANLATDGNRNGGGDPEDAAERMIDAGWDALSFEAIGSNITTSSLDFGFESTLTGGVLPVTGVSDPKFCGTINSSAGITNPLTDCFIVTTTFDDLDDVYRGKIIASIVGTGGDPDPIDPVPLPASLPILGSGIALIGALRLRRRRKAA